MPDEQDGPSGWQLLLDRRAFLQLGAASPLLLQNALNQEIDSLDADPPPDGSPAEEPANAWRTSPPTVPSPTERRDYFPLESELVSVRGLAPSGDADEADEVWLDRQTLSLRALARWRHENGVGFLPGFPHSVRELITPQEVAEEPDTVASRWLNWLDDHKDETVENKGSPDSMLHLVGLVRNRAKHESPFRAVGSGHSHSAAAAPDGWYTNMKDVSGKMDQPWLWDQEASFWQDSDIDPAHLVRVGAGTVLKKLNRDILPKDDLALPNMGSFDGQTVAGAVNTSTHGTGLELGTFADLVQSVEIVVAPESQYEKGTPYVRALRIEPSHGITDPVKFAADASTHGMALIQNDDLFHSVVVGYGCMGIVYAYTLKVRDAFWLREETTLMDWNTLKRKLSPSEDNPDAEAKAQAVRDFVTKDDTRHFQILLNIAAEQVPDEKTIVNPPGPATDDHEGPHNPVCMIRRHKEVPAQEKPWGWETQVARGVDTRWPPERRKKTAEDVALAISKVHPLKPNEGKAKLLHKNFFHAATRRPPFVSKRDETASYIALRRLRDRKNFPPTPPPLATSTEVAVPLEHFVEAVDEVRELVQHVTQTHEVNRPLRKPQDVEFDVFYGAPMGLRFTKQSEHFLSPEFDRPSAMVEVPFPAFDGGVKANLRPREPNLTQEQLRDEVAKPALKEIEVPLVTKFDGRPHLGKQNTVHAQSSIEDMRPQNMFPKYEKWLDAYRYLNAFGTFDGTFSENKTP